MNTQHTKSRNEIEIRDDHAAILIYPRSGIPVEVLIDLEDVDAAAEHNWFISGRYPATVVVDEVTREKKYLQLARLLLTPDSPYEEGYWIQRRNRNPLDSRKSNLLIVRHPRIKIAVDSSSESTPRYLMGIASQAGAWVANLCVRSEDGGSTIHYLGRYDTSLEAARAYDIAAVKMCPTKMLNFEEDREKYELGEITPPKRRRRGYYHDPKPPRLVQSIDLGATGTPW